MGLSHELTKPHFKAVIYAAYLDYIQKNYPTLDLKKLCEEAGLPLSYLRNKDNWVSVEFDEKFMKVVRIHTGEPDIAYNAGRNGLSPDVLGRSVYFLMKDLVPIDTGFKQSFKYGALFNKALVFDTHGSTPGKLRLRLSKNNDILNEIESAALDRCMPHILENMKGYYSGIPEMRGLPAAEVNIRTTRDINSKEINYILDIKYQFKKGLLERFEFPGFLALASLTFAIAYEWYNLQTSFLVTLSATLGAAFTRLLLTYSKTRDVALETEKSLMDLDQSYSELHLAQTQLVRKLKESEATSEVVSNASKIKDLGELYNETCRTLVDKLGYDRSFVLVPDTNAENLSYMSQKGISVDLLQSFTKLKLPIDVKSEDPKKISNVYRLQESLLVEDVNDHVKHLEDQNSIDLLVASGTKSFAAAPIASDGVCYGVLFVDCIKQGKRLDFDDLKIVSLVGKQLALAISRLEANKELKLSLSHQKALSVSYERFVPWETLKLLNYQSIFDVKLGDSSEKELTVFFSDIRNFTSLCESMPPSDVIRFLNSYFGALSPIIKKHNGVIDKFIGDCVMAIFSDPEDAVWAAIEIQRELVNYNLENRVGERLILEAGVGISKGPVIIGPLGFDRKMEITVLSDAVNVASRLDGQCGPLNAKILTNGIDFREINLPPKVVTEIAGMKQVKGRGEPIEITEVIDFNILKEVRKPKNDSEVKYLESVSKFLNSKSGNKKAA